jgi:hypothetical protein
MKYVITFTRQAFVEVEADSESEAFEEIGDYNVDNIPWSDEFEITEIQSEEETEDIIEET